jgi:RHS repeat-associated protein
MSLARVSLLFVFSLLVITPAYSQNSNTYVPTNPDNLLTPADPIGVPPHASSTGTNETINLSSGSLSIFLPALTLPQRGGWNLTLGYVHNSATYMSQQMVNAQASSYNEGQLLFGDYYIYTENMVPSGTAGLQINVPSLKATIEYEGDLKAYQTGASGATQFAQVSIFCVTNWVFTDWSGNKHSFNGTRTECNANSGYPGASSVKMPPNGAVAAIGAATDGSWYYLDTSNMADLHVITKGGTLYHFSGYVQQWPSPNYNVHNNQESGVYQAPFASLVDPNGNTVSYNSSTGVLTDTIGRQITITSSEGIQYTDSNGTARTINLTAPVYGASQPPYSFAPFSCSFTGSGYQPPFGGETLLGTNSFNLTPYSQNLVFPAVDTTGTSRTYQLQFDLLSRLTQINYPSGGYTKYIYSDNPAYQEMGQANCNIDLQEVHQKRECPTSAGNCSSSQELVTTYSPSIMAASSPFNASINETDPTGAYVQHEFDNTAIYPQAAPREVTTNVYTPSGGLLRTTSTTWIGCPGDTTVAGTITTTLQDVSPTLSSQEVRQYEPVGSGGGSCTIYYDNETQSNVYDYVSSGTGPLIKEVAQVWEPASAFTPLNILDRLESRTTTDPASGNIATLAYGYDVYGNITSKSVGGTSVTTLNSSYPRDAYGNIKQYTDPNGNITQFGYTDNWAQTTCAPPSSSSAYLTSITDALNHVTNISYDSCTGAKATATDPNGEETTYSFDGLGRPVQTNFPDGGQTSISYVDAIPNSTTATVLINASNRTTNTILDGYGRTIETQLTSDPDGTTYVDTTYDVLGRKATVSNPYRTANDPGPTNGITSYFYDALDRTCLVVPPDGTLPSSSYCPTTQPTNTVFTAYSGNTTTATDQAGVSRKTQTDALGRLTYVWENPSGLNYETIYQYDGFGDLLNVTQNSSRPRVFTYNTLSQLVSATNPESGTVSYTYDNDGNTLTKTSWAENQTNGTPTGATGSVTISGTAECEDNVCDEGTIYVTVGSFEATTTYGNSVSSSLASALASQFSSSSSPVTATVSGSTILFTSIATGPSANYALSASVQNSSSGSGFPKAAFSVSTSGSALTGGSNPPTTVASYTYDALSRLTQKSFTDGTPTANYYYDGATPSACSPALNPSYPIGRRTAMCDAVGMEAWGYDRMGRMAVDQRTTEGITYSTSYSYFLDGSLASLTYPSGTIAEFTVGGASRPLSEETEGVTGNSEINYVSNVHYAPQGAITSLTFNAPYGTEQFYTPTYATYLYNSRLQPCWMYATTGTALPWNSSSTGCASTATTGNVFDLKYNFGLGINDNGNVLGTTNDRDNTRSQNFSYDPLNRISSAQTQTTGVTIPNSNCWGLTFGYDAWGNLLTSTVSGPSGCSEPASLSVTATASNQISGYCYDGAGNLLVEGACPSSPPYTYTYDAEHHLTSTAGITYSYDGDGKRVYKANSGGTIYWYGGGAEALDETAANGTIVSNSTYEYMYFNGQRIARFYYNVKKELSKELISYWWNFYLSDNLNSSRVVTDFNGNILDDSDYYPFGLERPVSSSSGNHYKFDGKIFDSESGLLDYGARYYANTLGRFMQPDWSAKPTTVPYADFANPQSLNQYSYVGNNPLAHADPDGHCWPAQSCFAAIAQAVNNFSNKVLNNSGSSSPAVAALKTFGAGVLASTVKMAASPLTMGTATGACMGGSGCSTGQAALAVGGDILKGASIAAPLGAVGSKLAGALEGASDLATTTVTHFTSDAGMEAISESGTLRAGTYVTTPGEIPGGATSGEVESLLEIGPGKGANSITFDTPNSNLTVPGNGPTTSGGATQFQLNNPTPIDPTKFKPTPPSQ